MKLSKKGGGIAAAVVMAGGIAAATTTSAFAAPTGTPHATPAAKGVEKDKKDADKTHHKHGRHARFLTGTTLDFSVKNLLEGGWVFNNPNASRSCGCGTSFTPKV